MTGFAAFIELLRQFCAGIPGLQTLASQPFLFRPFLMIVTLGLVGGLIGVLINLRCAEFNAEAMVHSVFPGIVAGAIYGGIDRIIPAASAVAVLAAVALTFVGRHAHGRTSEAGTAVVLTSFFSFGMVLSLKKGDMSGQLEALMFGRLLEVTDARLAQALVVCALAGLLVLVTWPGQVFIAFDSAGAQASGVQARSLELTLNIAIAAVVAAASSAIGTLLVIGYFVVPGAAARLLCSTVRTMRWVAVAVGVGGGYLGMIAMTLPAPRPVSPQASVALSVTALYFVAIGLRVLRQLFAHRAAVARAGQGADKRSRSKAQGASRRQVGIENNVGVRGKVDDAVVRDRRGGVDWAKIELAADAGGVSVDIVGARGKVDDAVVRDRRSGADRANNELAADAGGVSVDVVGAPGKSMVNAVRGKQS